MTSQAIGSVPTTAQRRFMVVMNAIAVLCTVAALATIVHASLGPPGSIHFGWDFYPRAGAVVLAPAVVGWLLMRFVRRRAAVWAAIILSFVSASIGGNLLSHASISFRPIFGHASYDEAVIQSATLLLATTPPLTDQVKTEIKSFRPRLKAASDNKAALNGLVNDCEQMIQRFEQEIAKCQSWPDDVRAAFAARGVSADRAEEYLREISSSVSLDRAVEANLKIIKGLKVIRDDAARQLAELP